MAQSPSTHTEAGESQPRPAHSAAACSRLGAKYEAHLRREMKAQAWCVSSAAVLSLGAKPQGGVCGSECLGKQLPLQPGVLWVVQDKMGAILGVKDLVALTGVRADPLGTTLVPAVQHAPLRSGAAFMANSFSLCTPKRQHICRIKVSLAMRQQRAVSTPSVEALGQLSSPWDPAAKAHSARSCSWSTRVPAAPAAGN